MRLILDSEPLEFAAGDSVLLAMMRAGKTPAGPLCFGGDCPNCLTVIDGVAYMRACQTTAQPGMVVQSQPIEQYPELPLTERHGPLSVAENLFCDLVVIGMGQAGQAAASAARAAGKEVVVLDHGQGSEAVGIYVGPLVVARTAAGMLHIHAREEVVVATGAAEIQPVVPGSRLIGILTPRALAQVAAAGLPLGETVVVGAPLAGVEATVVQGELVRFEGEARVAAVVVRDEAGLERRYPCDTVAVDLGLHPRDALRRMGHDLPVRAVGEAAAAATIPACPAAGLVCPCSGVSVADLERIWAQGFREMELVKRATLAGTGTCQGSVCIPYLRAFLRDKGERLQPPFTARPVTRQLTLGEIAAGAHHQATARTGLDGEHRRLGAQMDRSGGWWRPWNYGDLNGEYWAAREAVSLMDVSTLGKFVVSGPDVLPFLERIYPTQIGTIRNGRSRYVLVLNERGYVFDDGLVCKESDTRYTLTFTSGGASHAEMWLRDWAASRGYDVRILNQTQALGAINVTGPLANELLARAGLETPPAYMGHMRADIAGVACQIFRLSFTGELSYELHHPVADSVRLWRALLSLGADLGIRPHGLETLLRLRLEKGHIIVGQDSDFDATPRRLGHEWAVKMAKPEFIGRQALLRTDVIPLDKLLVGLEMASPAPPEGSIVWSGGEYAGYVTSSTDSPSLGKAVMLGWLYFRDGALPADLMIDGRTARQAELPFYDKEGRRARA